METKSEIQQGKRILLVEDERGVRNTIRQLLHHDHHTVVEANNGADALGLFTQNKFDLVLTDSVLPYLHGAALASCIKYMQPEQPILMMTGHSMKPSPRNPVDAVLRKPFGLGELRSAMAEVL